MPDRDDQRVSPQYRGPWPVVTGLTRAEPMAHQRGPVPVALQVLFGLNELAVHHYDVTAPSGPGYRPPDAVLGPLAQMHERTGGLPPGGDLWDRILRRTGRNGGA